MGRLEREITDREWDMFQRTQNIGGRASCQDDRETFYRMRESQWRTLPLEVLESYDRDLETAQTQGRNLVAEKYGYMMESYDPEGFAQIQSQLPPKTQEELSLVEQLVSDHLNWYEELREEIPHILAGGRHLRTREDCMGDVSIETYLRGELKTYSLETLRAYASFAKECKAQGRNLVRENYEEMARAYGYRDLRQAEEGSADRLALMEEGLSGD